MLLGRPSWENDFIGISFKARDKGVAWGYGFTVTMVMVSLFGGRWFTLTGRTDACLQTQQQRGCRSSVHGTGRSGSCGVTFVDAHMRQTTNR